MRKYLFLFLAAAAFCGCDNDDNLFPSNQEVVESLLTQYPSAQDVTWARAWGYWVAEFNRADGEIMVECEAWFSNDGVWYLGVSNIPYTTLPTAVQNAFATSQYAQWFIDEVDMVERYNSEDVYVVEAEMDEGNEANDVDLYYTADGTLIRAIMNGAAPDFRPIILGDTVTAYLAENYPSATIIDVSSSTDITEVDVMDGVTLRKIYFDSKNEWLMTASRITVAELPEIVMQTIAASQYAAWEIEQAEYIANPDGDYYQVTLESTTGEQVVMKISDEGRIYSNII